VEQRDGILRDEPLDREVFDTVFQAKDLIARWRRQHAALGSTRGAQQRHP